MPLQPGRYVITAEQGVCSRLTPSKNSEKVKDSSEYPQHTTLALIKIQNVLSEERIRGQIKDSLDWVSIKNTSDGYMWMKPILPQVTPKYIMQPTINFQNYKTKIKQNNPQR